MNNAEFCCDDALEGWGPRVKRSAHWRDPDREFKRRIAEAWISSRVQAPLEVQFSRLADEWTRRTEYLSSVTSMINDSSYQEIIGLGWPVVPHLLNDLRDKKRFWFPALAAITGVRPFDPSDAANYQRMQEAWLRWGKRKGLI